MNPLYKIHNESSAPEKALPLLEATKEKLKFIPNLLGAMAEAPQVAETFMSLTKVSHSLSFSAHDREIVITIISKENGCDYCVANHSMIAEQLKIIPNVINSIKNNQTLDDFRIESLRQFIIESMRQKGHVSVETIG